MTPVEKSTGIRTYAQTSMLVPVYARMYALLKYQCMHARTHECMYLFTGVLCRIACLSAVCINACMPLCMYVCTHACMHVCIQECVVCIKGCTYDRMIA